MDNLHVSKGPDLRVWSEAFLSFHPSALLELYRGDYPFRERMLYLLKRLTNQLWLPHQAGLDYHKLRGSVIEETASSVSDDQQESYINTTRATRAYVLSLFVGRVGAPFADMVERRMEAEHRLRNMIPPGYAERNRTRAHADVFMWLQLVDHARTTGRPCIFVTEALTEDWIWHLDGQLRGPRRELEREMREVAGVNLVLMNWDTFAPHAAAYLEHLEFEDNDAWGDEETTSSG